jgi:hypothetical protein
MIDLTVEPVRRLGINPSEKEHPMTHKIKIVDFQHRWPPPFWTVMVDGRELRVEINPWVKINEVNDPASPGRSIELSDEARGAIETEISAEIDRLTNNDVKGQLEMYRLLEE